MVPAPEARSTASPPQVRIRDLVEAKVRANPAGDINYFDLLTQLEDSAISVEMVTGALRRLAEEGLLLEDRREKVARAEAKDRKVIQYRATPELKARLGLIAPTVVVPDATHPPEILRRIYEFADAAGFVSSLADVANFFLCLQAKPFVILSGISGTGKTQLPRFVAAATGAAHFLIPVKPNWSDNSDLMGYFSATLNTFIPGRLLEVIQAAAKEPARPFFVVLDEMNLAHVEHYLSDLLSVAETRHRDEGRKVVTDPLPLDLPSAYEGDDARDKWAALRHVVLPWNLFLVGTVNVDETTHPFSRKVLDRAFAIDFNDVDLNRFGEATRHAGKSTVAAAHSLFLDRPLSIREVYEAEPEFFDQLAAELAQINERLREADLHFAYRVRDEIALYMWAWRRHGLASLLSRNDAFDFCLLQKVLPRCQGSSETARKVLESVFRHASVEVPVAEDSPGDSTAIATVTAQSTEDMPVTPAATVVAGREGGALDLREVLEPTGIRRWRYPRTARKALRMLRRYADTGYYAFWS